MCSYEGSRPEPSVAKQDGRPLEKEEGTPWAGGEPERVMRLGECISSPSREDPTARDAAEESNQVRGENGDEYLCWGSLQS